mmetsp:Transcript_11499/g.36544  ORF Transcript_11499/g.36544 Transcript_11499/m.36544 type:complete len:427 (-) Transcript_11499:68-1348(-)
MLEPLVRGASRVTYALYPVATYLPQFYEVKRSGKEGFSSATCLVVLALSVLRVAYWVVRRVREWSYMVYSITLTLMQFYLLEAILSARRKKQTAVPPLSARSHQRTGRAEYGATSAALASNVKKLVKAWLRSDREGAGALWRKLRRSFWAWDELPPYVEVVVVMSLGVAVGSVAALRVASRDGYARFVGTCVAACDVLVAAPQLRLNCLRRDTAGLSTLMVAAWLARDLVLFLNQRLASRQNEQLGAVDVGAGTWHRQLVASPRTCLALFRVAADALVLAQIAVFAYRPRTDEPADRRRAACCLRPRGAKSKQKKLSAFFGFHGASPRSYIQDETLADDDDRRPLVPNEAGRSPPTSPLNNGAPSPQPASPPLPLQPPPPTAKVSPPTGPHKTVDPGNDDLEGAPPSSAGPAGGPRAAARHFVPAS